MEVDPRAARPTIRHRYKAQFPYRGEQHGGFRADPSPRTKGSHAVADIKLPNHR